MKGEDTMELKGKDLVNYGLLEGYAENELKWDPENVLVHQWIDEIRMESPDAWSKAKEKYDIYKFW